MTVVSKRNHFLFTPLLTTCCVGTLEFRNITTPVERARKDGRLRFVHAEATKLDLEKNEVACRSVFDVARNDDECAERFFPEFNISYDKLIIATGAKAATFGIPGVEEYTYPLKSVGDARAVRQRLIRIFEVCSSPFAEESEKRRLLHFVVVGGGPTSIEFCGELYDFVTQDLASLHPELIKYCKITLVEASDRVLGGFSEALSNYTMRLFKTRNIELLLKQTVKVVHPHSMEMSDGTNISFGLCVWSTGNTMIPFVQNLPFEKEERRLSCCVLLIVSDFFFFLKSGKLLVDEYLRVKPDMYAIGDCASERGHPRPATAQVRPNLLSNNISSFFFSKTQVANQQGIWLAKHLDGRVKDPFTFKNRGMLAYVGGMRALVDLPTFRSSGFGAWLLWTSAYLTSMVSWANKIQNPISWAKAKVFGRDISSFEDKKSW